MNGTAGAPATHPGPTASQPVVILAAGHGTRMGGPKVFTRIGAATFLERILERVREGGGPVTLLVDGRFQPRVEELLAGLPPLPLRMVSADGTQPMLTSVRAGLGALPPDAPGAWVWPVDAPLISSAGWRQARAAVAQRRDAIVKLRTDGRTGHPTWFPRWACDAILDREWEDGLLGFLSGVPAARIVLVDLPGETLTDFNTPEQLAAAGLL